VELVSNINKKKTINQLKKVERKCEGDREKEKTHK